MRRPPPLNFRAPDDLHAQLDGHAQLVRASRSAIVVAALREYLERHRPAAASSLLDELGHDIRSVTLRVRVGQDGPAAEVVDVARRTVDPLGRPHSPTSAPLGQLVGIEAHAERAGRVTIELTGLPHTEHAGVRIHVATLTCSTEPPPPEAGPRPGPSVTIALDDLYPDPTQEAP